MDIDQLLKECRQGSAAAQKCLFDLYADRMFLLCCRYVKNSADAEELLLDGFFKLFRALPEFQYKGEAAFEGWMKRILVNECLMHLRKRKAFQITVETEAAEIAAPEPDLLDRMSTSEILELVLQLPVGYRTVFNLFEMEGMNHREIAEQLEISEGTSKSQLSKARQLLQKMIIQKDSAYARRISK
jgi:RNA polymerase sigma factor (sigma-70 family)